MPPRSAPPPGRLLESIALAHAGILLTATTWGFGGNAGWIRPWLAAWASLSLPIAVAACWHRPERAAVPVFRWLWPLVLFNVLALAACLTPSFIRMNSETNIVLIPRLVPAWKPSAAVPELVGPQLWLFSAFYLAAFNLVLAVRSRQRLRGFLLFAMANALALAVFGTLQKLSHATGIYFGRVKSPQDYFFATFVYDNHWGAFIVLMTALSVGLVSRYAARSPPGEFFRTPGFAGLVAILCLAATVPLSGSRACTLLLIGLLGAALIRAMARIVGARRREQRSVAGPVGGALLAAAAALALIWYVAGDVITLRIAKTQEQVAEMREAGSIGDRALLYHNTWQMARARPWFGWGTASYPHVFMLYNTQKPNRQDHLPIFYHDAHSDWLQSLAEHGLVGTVLLGLCAAAPLAAAGGRRRLANPVSSFLLIGCGLILLYAAVEFPFGNAAVMLSWWLCFFSAIAYARLAPAPGPLRSP